MIPHFARVEGLAARCSPRVFATMPGMSDAHARVAIVMGSQSDWPVMKRSAETLAEFGVPYRARVISAHRALPTLLDFLGACEADGVQVVIAGAGGAAHLPGVCAAATTLPVLGVPMESLLDGLDSLLSIVQMPKGIPVGTLAIGGAGATNAALLAIAVLALQDAGLREKLAAFRAGQSREYGHDPASKA